MKYLFSLSKNIRQLIIMSCDIFAVVFSIFLSISIRYEKITFPNVNILDLFLAPIIILLIIFYFFQTYKSMVRYTGLENLINLFYACSIYSAFISLYFIFFAIPDIPRSIGVISSVLLTVYIISSRIIIANLFIYINSANEKNNILIYGAEEMGVQVYHFMLNQNKYKVVGFIESDKTKIGKLIEGTKIYDENKLEIIAKKYQVKNILIALDRLGIKETDRRNKIIHRIKDKNIKINSVPSIDHIISGKVKLTDFKEIQLEDIFSRTIKWDINGIKNLVKDKKILITGAGGSIGSELTRQIGTYEPKSMLLIENNEYNLFKIENDLIKIEEKMNKKINFNSILCDIRNQKAIDNLFNDFNPDIVIHSAAYKHVDLVERNISEAVSNNIFGTANLIEVSRKYQVGQFLFISTDKAVRPKSYMGLTKRIAEIYIQSFYQNYKDDFKTKISIVRFGNVLESSGSVVPLFKEQIKCGGPITVTHKYAERYFMTIPEAVGLVLQSATLTENCEIFVLDMGAPWKIIDLAKSMIKLSGLREKIGSDGDIEIKITGLKKGEKLKEELILGDNLKKTKYKEILFANEKLFAFNGIDSIMASIERAIEVNDHQEVIHLLNNISYESDKITIN